MDKAKNVRRAVKGTLTRAINACKELIGSGRPINEVAKVFQSLKSAYKALEDKHDEFTMLLEDKDFDEAEEWMRACSYEYTSCCVMFNDYANANVAKNEEDDVHEVNSVKGNEDGENHQNPGSNEEAESDVIPVEQPSNISGGEKVSSPFSLKH